MMNRVYRCRMIAIVIWSLFQVTTGISQAPKNQLPDGKLCLFTCSEWIFEEKVSQFAPSANLLGPGQLSKHTIGLPYDHGSNSRTSSNGPNYHNVWGAVYIIDKNECDAVIKQSQSEYETPFLSNEDVIVVKHGEMNCLTVDLGIQPGDHPPRHHPSNILPNTNQDEAYYEQLAKLGVPQDYINGLQLASQRNHQHPIIPRDYHPARYNKKRNSSPNNQLPNQISGQQDDVSPSVTIEVPRQQNLYPNQDYVEITPLELPRTEDEPKSFQRINPPVPEKNDHISPSQMVSQQPNQRKVNSQKPMQPKSHSSVESSEEEEPKLSYNQQKRIIPSRSSENAPVNQQPKQPKVISQKPKQPKSYSSEESLEEEEPEVTPVQSTRITPSRSSENAPVNQQPNQPKVISQKPKQPKSHSSEESLEEEEPELKPVQPKQIIPSRFRPVNENDYGNREVDQPIEYVPLTNKEVDEAPSMVVITPFKNPRMVATPVDANHNQPCKNTQPLKPQNNLPKSGVLGFPKSNNSPTSTTQQDKNPTLLSPTTDSTTPTVVINPNHPVSRSPRSKTPTVLISPNESSPKVNVSDEQHPQQPTLTNQQEISPEVKIPHNPTSSPTISSDNNGGNLSVPNLPPNFITGENPSVLSDEPMFIPSNEDALPSILADFATTDTSPELPDHPMFLPEDESSVRSLPSDFGTNNNIPSQPNQPTSISTENDSLLPLLSDFSTTDTPTLLSDQPMFIPEESNSLSIPPHIATTENPTALPDEPMFILDDNIEDNTIEHDVPQQVNRSSPVITPSHPHATGYIPKSVLDEKHAQKNNDSPIVQNAPQASKIEPSPQHNEKLIKPTSPPTKEISKVPSNSNIQTIEPEIADRNTRPTQPILLKSPDESRTLIQPSTVKQPGNEVPPITKTHPNVTGALLKPTVETENKPVKTENKPVETVQSVTPVKQKPSQQVIPPSSSQVHTTGIQPKLADRSSGPAQPVQTVIPAKQSSQPNNKIDSQPNLSEEEVPITIPQDDQNNGSSSNYDPSTFMVPNYTPDSSFLGYTFGTYFPRYIQKYDPQYEPSNCVYSPEEFVPGFTFGSHCQLY